MTLSTTSPLLVTTITCVIDITGELTSMLLLSSCPVNMASCWCLLFYKVSSDLLSTQLSTRSSIMTSMLCMAWDKSVLLVRSRVESWSEETQSHLSEKYLGLCSEDQREGAWTGNPSWFPDTLSLRCKRSVEMVCCGTTPRKLVSDFCFLFC